MATTVLTDSPLKRDAEQLNDALGELLRVVQFRDRDRACCYDVSVSQCYALKSIVDAGGLTVNELAAALFLDKSTASRLANSLVDKGYLARSRDPGDGRVVRLVATPAGGAMSERIDRDTTVEYAQLLEDFAPEVRTGLVQLVGRLGRCFAGSVQASGGSCCVVK